VKKKELANEIVGLIGIIIFKNELTLKCVGGFGGFVEISRQLMV